MKCDVWLSLLALLLLSGCASVPTVAERTAYADQLARSSGWHRETLQAGELALAAYLPEPPQTATTLTIYIEGDGLSWVGTRRPSLNPTPLNPLALQLALRQPTGSSAYLGRPCQYVPASDSGCHQRYWTNARFSEDVIRASDKAVDLLRRRFHASKLQLVGYSGGAAVAALLAARRHDVVGLITVAGNLDHQAWSRHHQLAPLTDSLNPSDVAPELGTIDQLHWVGGRDRIITPNLSGQFTKRLTEPDTARRNVISDFDHQCCWVRDWPELWRAWDRHRHR